MSYCNSECCYEVSSHQGRNFFTREEKIEMLKSYKEKLENEAKGVAERIETLHKHKDNHDED